MKTNLDGEQNKWTKSKFMSEQKKDGFKNKKICSFVVFLLLVVTSIRITKKMPEKVCKYAWVRREREICNVVWREGSLHKGE